jgi:16S rRNA (guanine(966)-N(2))-methyltransferase RsmD
MRIVSGIHKGRSIAMPHGFKCRPTTDFAKEAIFNIAALHFDFEHTIALDLFAGSGAIGLEMASRGCGHVDSVEISQRYCSHLRNMAQVLHLPQVHVHSMCAFAYINGCTRRYDLIFADPPYDLHTLAALPDIIFDKQLLNPHGWLILEHGMHNRFDSRQHFVQHRKYGSVNFSIFA